MSTWTRDDVEVSHFEGWGVFCNTDHGWQIERIDDMAEITGVEGALPIFAWDKDAVAFVEAEAAKGSDLHKRALAFVEQMRTEAAAAKASSDPNWGTF